MQKNSQGVLEKAKKEKKNETNSVIFYAVLIEYIWNGKNKFSYK